MNDKKPTQSNPNVPGAELLYDGRTLVVQVLINTDEVADVIGDRIRKAAAGPKRVMHLVMISEPSVEDAQKVWEEAWTAAESMLRTKKGK